MDLLENFPVAQPANEDAVERQGDRVFGCQRHAEALTGLYDNPKVVVTRYEDGEPVYNTRLLGFATHYGYRPMACRPRRTQTKGKGP